MSFLNIWGAELVIIILVLSTNIIGLDIADIVLGKSLIYNRKNKGPNMEPWGTPCLTGCQSEVYMFQLQNVQPSNSHFPPPMHKLYLKN
jgi:hypothetical protein